MLTTALLVAMAACGPREKPSGTSGDPVEVCERIGDVCRLDKSRLGVCSPTQGSELACMSQH